MQTKIELLKIELFDHLTVCIDKVCLQIIFNIFVKTGFGIKYSTVIDMSFNLTKHNYGQLITIHMYTPTCTYKHTYIYLQPLMCLHICTYIYLTLYTTSPESIVSKMAKIISVGWHFEA